VTQQFHLDLVTLSKLRVHPAFTAVEGEAMNSFLLRLPSGNKREGTKLSETGIPATGVDRDVGALPLDTVRKIS
jgi:hypothetical protein